MNKLEEILKKIQDEFTTIFTNLKGIFIKKDKSADESDESDAQTKSNISTNKIQDSDENNEITEDATEVTEKKNILNSLDVPTLKKKAPMIILIMALVYLVADEFLIPKKEVNSEPIQVKKKRAPKKKKKVVKEIKEEPKIKVVKKREVIKPKVVEKPKEIVEAPKQEPEKQPEEINKVDASAVPFETAITVESPRVVGENKEKKVEMDISFEESIKKAVETVSNEDELISDYISPPSYLRFGRGLVYNCKGKHWACVDQYSYLTCRENENWNEQNKKKIECKTKNTYATNSDCIKVQTYYTNNSEKTDFCERMN